MFLYANGDSFTSGAELASDTLPGFPGNLAEAPFFEIARRNQKWMNNIYRRHSNLMPAYLDESRRRAYPQKVADIVKCKVFNNALGGGSMDYIARTTILDLLSLKNEHKGIVALIGTTSAFRIDVPLKEEVGCDMWLSTQIGSDHPQHIPAVFDEYYVKNYSEYHALTNYYRNLIQIQDFCKVNNIRLILIDAMSEQNIAPKHNPKEAEKIARLKDYVKGYDFDMSRTASRIKGNTFAPCGHFSEIVHASLAEEIVKIL